MVLGGRRAHDREAPEAVITLDESGPGVQSAPLQGLPDCQLVPSAKWRACFVIRTDVITITSAQCAVSCMELVPHLRGRCDPDIGRQHCVERALELRNAASPSLRDANAHRLPSGVNSRVRTA